MDERGRAAEGIRSRTGTTWIDERHNVLRFDAFAGAEQSLADATENMDAVVKLSAGKRYPMLVDLTRSRALGPGARDYYGRPESRMNYSALAILGQSPISRMLGNTWLAIYGDRHVPTRLFTVEAEAIAWLKGFVSR